MADDRHDFELDRDSADEPFYDLGETEEGARRRPVLGIVLFAVALLVAGLAYWWLQRETSTEPVEPSPPAPEADLEPAETPAPEPVEVPPLDESDAWIRAVAEQLSEHPLLAAWLVNDELVRRFVAAVDNVADGISPRNHVAFAAPEGDFPTPDTDGTMTGAAMDRYSPIVAAIGSLHVEGTVDLYRHLEPRFDEAYRDLGFPDARFSESLTRAVRRILEAPVLTEPPALVAVPGGWELADPELEALDDATKHLLRLGPDNLTLLQRKVRRVAEALGLDV